MDESKTPKLKPSKALGGKSEDFRNLVDRPSQLWETAARAMNWQERQTAEACPGNPRRVQNKSQGNIAVAGPPRCKIRISGART